MRSDLSSALAARHAEEEAGGEQIAGAGRVDQLRRPAQQERRRARPLLDRQRAMLAAGDDQHLDLRRDRRDGAFEMRNAGERPISAWLAKRMSTRPLSISCMKPSRCRSTQKVSDSVKATFRARLARDLDRLAPSPSAASPGSQR